MKRPAVLDIAEGYELLKKEQANKAKENVQTIDITGKDGPKLTKDEKIDLLTKAVADLTLRMNELTGEGKGAK